MVSPVPGGAVVAKNQWLVFHGGVPLCSRERSGCCLGIGSSNVRFRRFCSYFGLVFIMFVV
jgi:hypothetical protein